MVSQTDAGRQAVMISQKGSGTMMKIGDRFKDKSKGEVLNKNTSLDSFMD